MLVIIPKKINDVRLKGIKNVLKPSKNFLWGALDTNQDCIIKTIKQGELDMEKYIIENNLMQK